MNPAILTAITFLCGLLASVNSLAQTNPQTKETWTFHHDHILGTSMDLQIHASAELDAQRAQEAILKEIARLNPILSTWNPQSEASTWIRSSGNPTPVSPELFEVLDLFDQWRVESRGALNPAVQVLIDQWKKGVTEQKLPSTAQLSQAVRQANTPQWSLDPAHHTATRLSHTPLVFSSFVKSYIMKRAINAAFTSSQNQRPIVSILINIGGDIVTQGPITHTVSIANPQDDAENSAPLTQIKIRNQAMATSGGYRRGFEIAGQHYSHILDPRTGQPAGHILSATVVANDPTTAGALATCLCILSPDEGLRLVSQHPGTECLLVTSEGRQITSPQWNSLKVAPPTLVASANPQAASSPNSGAAPKTTPTSTSSSWDPNMELVVSLEIAPSTDPRYRRPFVAVWIEDNDKYPVRTIALWYKGERWLPDLRGWSHADQLRAVAEGTDLTTTVSSATRSPGKYTIKWDGKDNSGKFVKPGTYTVYVEAAREHGTYQIAKQEIMFSNQPAHFDLKGGTELSKISLDYHRK